MKRILKQLYTSIIRKEYNRKHNTQIRSNLASLSAQYGKKVLIDEGTIVTNDVFIGDYSYVNKNSSVENAIIGKYCSISSGVWICPTEHDISFRTTSPFINKNANKKRECVEIGNDVLISLNVIILEGIKIGDGAVIGAGAIVTKDVKPYEIVGGVPAKHIKWRFSEEKIATLLSLRWWNNTYEQNLSNVDFFTKETDYYRQ